MSLRFERFASASFRDFEDVVELYRSNSGAVYCGKYKFDNIIYVLKEKKVSELGKKKDVMNEVRLLAQLCHPNVITCEGWFNDSERMSMFIILEYCPGGDLSKKVDLRRKSRKFFSEEYIWFLFHQMVLGVQHLHINGIIHRDLKLLNVVLSKKDTVVKIADLGVSRQVSRNTAMLDTFIGTPLYLSPELVDNKPYNEKTDIWSLGVILYELCALTPPFRGHNVLALSNMIRAGRYEPLPGIYSTDMEKCVQWLLNVNYLQRPTINQLLEFVEKHISPSYHGEDMAAEWDMNNHSVSKLVVIPGSPDRNKQIVDRAPIDKCFEGQAEDSSEEVDEGDSLEDNDQSGHEELHDRKKHRHHRRHRRHSRRRHSHSSDDDISDVSEDSLDRKKKPHRKHRSHSKDRGRGRESDADQLEKSHRDRSKSRQKYHNAESEPEERYKRGKRPHTSSHGNRKESEYDRPPAGSGVNAARKGKKKSHVHPNQESVPTPKNPSSTLIQFEVSRLQMLLKREASQLTRLVKLKDFFLLNSTIENEKEVPVSKSAPNRPKTAPLPNEETNQSSAISGVDLKIKQCNERMAILKRGIQNNGALTREEIAK